MPDRNAGKGLYDDEPSQNPLPRQKYIILPGKKHGIINPFLCGKGLNVRKNLFDCFYQSQTAAERHEILGNTDYRIVDLKVVPYLFPEI